MIRQPFAPQPLREIATLIHFINCCALYSVGRSICRKECLMRITDYCGKRFPHKSAFWFYSYFRHAAAEARRNERRRDEAKLSWGCSPSRRSESDLIRGIRYYSRDRVDVTGIRMVPPRQVCRNHRSNVDTVRANIISTSNVGQRKRQWLANDPVEHGWR